MADYLTARKRMPKPGLIGLSCALLMVPAIAATIAIAPLAAQAQTVATSVAQGYTLLAQDRVNEAIGAFEAVLRRNPQDMDALQGLGIAYRRAGRDADALATYQRILALDPNNRLALGTIGYLGEFRSEWNTLGIDALSRLLALEPNNLEARAQRAKLYFFQGLLSPSLADYALVLSQTRDPDILRTAAEAYTYSGDYAMGLSLFQQYQAAGEKIQGDTAIAYAQALRESGNLPQATQILENELQRHPEFNTQHIRLRGALATTYAANRQYEAALDLIQPLQGRNDSRLTLARALNAIGEYSQQPIYSQQAAQIYQTVLATVPNLTPGMRREAIAVFSPLPEYQPAALQLAQQLGQAYPQDASLTFTQQVLAYQTGQLSRVAFVNQVQSTFPSLPGDPVQVRDMGRTLSRLTPPVPELLPLYQSLIAAGATDDFLQFRVAQIFAQQGQLAAAKATLGTYAATPSGRRDPEPVQLLLADIERREGNLVASTQRYETLINTTRTPGIRRGALQGLAAVYQVQGRYAEAIALYDQLIAENPQEPAYVLGRTALAYQAGAISEAQAVAVLNAGVQQYGTTNPPPELITLATVLPADASRAALYQTLLVAEPTNRGLQLRSLQVLAEEDPEQAKAQIAQWIAANPQDLDLYFVQGDIAQQTGDFDLARQSYTAILQQQPNNLDALLALGGLEFQAGNYARADELYTRALALNGDNATARSSLAALTAANGYPLEAIEQLKAWQNQQAAQGLASAQVNQQIQRIEESLLLQRGIQPPWERF